MSGNVFAADEISVDVSVDAARGRLEQLAQDGVLLGAAEYAYGAGITGLVETAEPAAGMSRLAGVRAEGICGGGGGARLRLRGVAMGGGGGGVPGVDGGVRR